MCNQARHRLRRQRTRKCRWVSALAPARLSVGDTTGRIRSLRIRKHVDIRCNSPLYFDQCNRSVVLTVSGCLEHRHRHQPAGYQPSDEQHDRFWRLVSELSITCVGMKPCFTAAVHGIWYIYCEKTSVVFHVVTLMSAFLENELVKPACKVSGGYCAPTSDALQGRGKGKVSRVSLEALGKLLLLNNQTHLIKLYLVIMTYMLSHCHRKTVKLWVWAIEICFCRFVVFRHHYGACKVNVLC